MDRIDRTERIDYDTYIRYADRLRAGAVDRLLNQAAQALARPLRALRESLRGLPGGGAGLRRPTPGAGC